MNTPFSLDALKTKLTDQPAVYVGTYGKYNNGNIAGAWVDLTLIESEQHFMYVCAELHKDEADPEYMYQDYQGFNQRLYDEGSIKPYFDFLQEIEDNNLQDVDIEAINAFIDYFGMDSLNRFEDAYQGKYDSERDFSDTLFDEFYLHDVPQSIIFYIDYEAFSRDLFINDYTYINGYVFNNHF
jgi:antirestriction protein